MKTWQRIVTFGGALPAFTLWSYWIGHAPAPTGSAGGGSDG